MSKSNIVSYRQSKLGQTNFTPSSHVGVMLTYNLETQVEDDMLDPEFLDPAASAYASLLSNLTGGAGAGNIDLNNPTGGRDETGSRRRAAASTGTQEILIGAGIRSISVEQQINVTQEAALGHFEIVETVSHNVQGNTFTMEKAMLRLRMLSSLGVATWGKDVITSPRLNAYILDDKERQRGVNLGFVKLIGLHINTNRLSSSVGQLMLENVTFRADRVVRVKRIPKALYLDMKKQFAEIYGGESLQPFELADEGE